MTDGGESGAMFDESEITDVTARQRAGEMANESLVQPFKIAWTDWRTKIGMIILAVFVVTGILTTLHASGYEWFNTAIGAAGSPWELSEPTSNQGPRFLQPFENWEHPLGTDRLGRDLFSAVLWATPAMLRMILAGAVFSVVVATVVGTLAGYKGGIVETVLMTASDIAMTIPGLPLVIVITTILEPSSDYVIGIIITINVWAGLARSIHSQTLSLREQSYVEASRTMGVSTPRILQKDILPNLMPYITVNFVYAARRVIYDSVALYFLGVLPFSTLNNWGVMMNLAYNNMAAFEVPGRMYLLLVPMTPVVFISLGLILFAQGTDRLFNPRVRTRHEGETVEEDGQDTEASTTIV